ncbi:hypothetical protein HYC85_000853 [Camellia sinensis]|uniref:Uncharacterized protein n=1 Tax=Camellia sinensis TaxID=4442 RepID=A0A7J7I5F9_CAMSI|nr:hypothetical protein HYC85_000853 [Camellia sinensis]
MGNAGRRDHDVDQSREALRRRALPRRTQALRFRLLRESIHRHLPLQQPRTRRRHPTPQLGIHPLFAVLWHHLLMVEMAKMIIHEDLPATVAAGVVICLIKIIQTETKTETKTETGNGSNACPSNFSFREDQLLPPN